MHLPKQQRASSVDALFLLEMTPLVIFIFNSEAFMAVIQKKQANLKHDGIFLHLSLILKPELILRRTKNVFGDRKKYGAAIFFINRR